MAFVELQQQGNVAVVTINRPEVLNALNSQVIHELDDGLTQIKRAEENPVLGELYARYVGDRAHELLHVHYHPKHD